jgi:hypothetical protein
MENYDPSSFVQSKLVKYRCDQCAKNHEFLVVVDEHLERIDNSSNGLTRYNSFHRCHSGILQLVNMDVDREFNTRSYQLINFETSGIKFGTASPTAPTPKVDKGRREEITIPILPSVDQLKLIIDDEILHTRINIGNITQGEERISTIASDQGSILLTFYPSDVAYTASMEKWLYFLVNAIEGFLASKLGLIVEVLVHMLNRRDAYPTDFDSQVVRTIFSSHEVYFELLKEWDDTLKDYFISKYSSDQASNFEALIKFMTANPETPLITYMKFYDGTFHDLISVFFVMELEGLITIHRPGIIEFF